MKDVAFIFETAGETLEFRPSFVVIQRKWKGDVVGYLSVQSSLGGESVLLLNGRRAGSAHGSGLPGNVPWGRPLRAWRWTGVTQQLRPLFKVAASYLHESRKPVVEEVHKASEGDLIQKCAIRDVGSLEEIRRVEGGPLERTVLGTDVAVKAEAYGAV